ncbi:uncharacterized protein A4U43_C09F5690 [Asparagus officinalis]|uniref:Exopolygalacturonase n=2 Tax=Asparagus officinalis TaxID=4686 RepID=A0A5P1E8U6_ASPOF|nr:uncharacterized protein A4U43_C09F5690 [Asparagus officinalis]
MASYNVMDFGARPDGRSDSARAFLAAWDKACRAHKPASIVVPAGRFYISQALFQGPCNNGALRIFIQGTLVAPSGYSHSSTWITFKYVEGVSIHGGTLDGQGQPLWKCKMRGGDCPGGATSLTIGESNNIVIDSLSSLNSEMFHISVFASSYVTIRGAKITAPGDSPNTDGIHIQKSTYVNVTGSTIETGDDCISMGEGTSNVWIEKVNCGPGHGISIGSLGDQPQQEGVQNITVKSVVFTGTQNGLRIKTWGKPSSGFVRGVTFRHAVMNYVQNPIVVDQNYCPGNVNCPNQSSGIKISKVSYNDIQGSSATPIAVKFDCSPTNPCRKIGLQNIKLTYGKKPAQSYCSHVHGKTSGFVIPPSCL